MRNDESGASADLYVITLGAQQSQTTVNYGRRALGNPSSRAIIGLVDYLKVLLARVKQNTRRTATRQRESYAILRDRPQGRKSTTDPCICTYFQ